MTYNAARHTQTATTAQRGRQMNEMPNDLWDFMRERKKF
jgi:hypothetical protein